MTDARRQEALDTIAAEVAGCTRCRLHTTRTRAVPGEGTSATEVLFVGEGPGFNEDRQGRPFVGQAGALLTDLLASVGWQREEVFITNVVKCRPPNNRDPEPDEIAACASYLTRQIEALDPALIVTLGRFSMARFSPGARIGQVHGTFRAADAASGAPDAFTFAMYHPAAALHQGSLKQTLFDDMKSVPSALVAARQARAARQGTGPAMTDAAAEALVEDVLAPAGGREAVAPADESVDRPVEPASEPVERAPEPVESGAQPALEPDLEPVDSGGQPAVEPVLEAVEPPALAAEPALEPVESDAPPSLEPALTVEPAGPPEVPDQPAEAVQTPSPAPAPDSREALAEAAVSEAEMRDPRAQLTLF